ncbi:MAG: porin [Proteobacteria bacterium]|nr:porin [Pseudomonadota bacterium]
MLGLAVLVAAAPAWSETPTTEAIWAIVQQQQQEINQLKQQLAQADEKLTVADQKIAETDRKLAQADAQLAATDQKVEATGEFLDSIAAPAALTKTHVGGYGELHYNNLDADDSSRDLDQVDFHRFVLFFSHEFSDRIRFFSELELEHSLAGDGKPGEVELEQAYLDFSLTDQLSAKAGLFLLPIGMLNETHEPPTFYGVERNSVESVIIPSTWWEAGGALTGHFENGLSWDFAVHSGLAIPTQGSNAFVVRSGRQKVAEANASDPAYTARVRYSGIPGLNLGMTYQYQADASQISGDGLDEGQLFSANAAYSIGAFTLKGVYARWEFEGSAVKAAGADIQTGWFIEPSYLFASDYGNWGIYGRYEEVDAARRQDQFTQNEVGLNFWPLDNVVFKLDIRQREHDLSSEEGRDFFGFDLGLGYQF